MTRMYKLVELPKHTDRVDSGADIVKATIFREMVFIRQHRLPRLNGLVVVETSINRILVRLLCLANIFPKDAEISQLLVFVSQQRDELAVICWNSQGAQMGTCRHSSSSVLSPLSRSTCATLWNLSTISWIWSKHTSVVIACLCSRPTCSLTTSRLCRVVSRTNAATELELASNRRFSCVDYRSKT